MLHCFLIVKSEIIFPVDLLSNICSLKNFVRGLLLSSRFPYCDLWLVFGRWLPRGFRCSTDFSMLDYNWLHLAQTLHLSLINTRLSSWANNLLGKSLGHLGKDSLEPLTSSSVPLMPYEKMALWDRTKWATFKYKAHLFAQDLI